MQDPAKKPRVLSVLWLIACAVSIEAIVLAALVALILLAVIAIA